MNYCKATKAIDLKYLLYFLCIFPILKCNTETEEFCYKDDAEEIQCQNDKNSDNHQYWNDNTRYIMYNVNPSEGFNLRRDVYMRFAVLAKKLKESPDPNLNNFELVLPPWSHLYHWHFSDIPEHIPWSYYFDLPSLQRFAPVIEMHQFFEKYPKNKRHVEIDEVYILRHFHDMFETGKFINKMEIKPCDLDFEQVTYFHYTNISSKSVQCLYFHGPASYLMEFLATSSAKIILFVQAEIVLHDSFGDKLYWQARRSMRFNKDLKAIAANYRYKYLSSSDHSDGINHPTNWEDEKPSRNTIGGAYLGIHMRRKDFFFGRPKELPTLDKVAKQIMSKLRELDLSVVFLATDTSSSDVKALQYMLSKNVILAQFRPDQRFVDKYKDGGKAIVEQIICSHARYFIGTFESTFSFRIQEEREIYGFPDETTFNALCADENDCKQPTVWKIVF